MNKVDFAKWFKNYVHDPLNNLTNLNIHSLAWGPLRIVKCWPIHKVNGFKFHTRSHSTGKSTQNYGICVKGIGYARGEIEIETTEDFAYQEDATNQSNNHISNDIDTIIDLLDTNSTIYDDDDDDDDDDEKLGDENEDEDEDKDEDENNEDEDQTEYFLKALIFTPIDNYMDLHPRQRRDEGDRRYDSDRAKWQRAARRQRLGETAVRGYTTARRWADQLEAKDRRDLRKVTVKPLKQSN
ncbi:uncharacterized protein LOC107466425 [Arachis duranensis]|uniref:Uncharacterized protein LOC107466425 n=1 Tax=Arachis duranensis TaxID=130453 RepID=A0A6P4BP79_ARADU|nr:uncharacterized protein LOC107466425 [Arachis duranensis]